MEKRIDPNGLDKHHDKKDADRSKAAIEPPSARAFFQ
jgi:hypothetical protein